MGQRHICPGVGGPGFLSRTHLHPDRVLLILTGFFTLYSAPQVRWELQAAGQTLELNLVTAVDGYEVEFGRIGAVVAGEDGQIFVADVHDLGQEIFVFDEHGNRTRVFGGKGGGPGEFMHMIPTLAWFGDALAAMEGFAGRRTIKLFDTQGHVLRTHTLPIESGLSGLRSHLFGSGPDILLLELTSPPPRVLDPDKPLEVFQPEARYEKLAPDGSVLPFPDLTEPGVLTGAGALRGLVYCQGKGGTWVSFFSPPFNDRGPLRAFTPNGDLVRATPDSLYIEIVDVETTAVVRSFSREFPMILLDDDAWNALPEIREIHALEEELGSEAEAFGSPGDPCGVFEMRPEFQPVVRSLVVDDQGRFWAELTGPEGFVLAGFDGQGTFLGQAPMPDRDPTVYPYVRANRLYIATVDDLGVQGIRVYEIR